MSNNHYFSTHYSYCETNNNRHKSIQNKLSTQINYLAIILAGKQKQQFTQSRFSPLRRSLRMICQNTTDIHLPDHIIYSPGSHKHCGTELQNNYILRCQSKWYPKVISYLVIHLHRLSIFKTRFNHLQVTQQLFVKFFLHVKNSFSC